MSTTMTTTTTTTTTTMMTTTTTTMTMTEEEDGLPMIAAEGELPPSMETENDGGDTPSKATLTLWNNICKSLQENEMEYLEETCGEGFQTYVESLQEASCYLQFNDANAVAFVRTSLKPMVKNLLNFSSAVVGRNWIQEALSAALDIILRCNPHEISHSQLDSDELMDTLALLLDPSQPYWPKPRRREAGSSRGGSFQQNLLSRLRGNKSGMEWLTHHVVFGRPKLASLGQVLDGLVNFVETATLAREQRRHGPLEDADFLEERRQLEKDEKEMYPFAMAVLTYLEAMDQDPFFAFLLGAPQKSAATDALASITKSLWRFFHHLAIHWHFHEHFFIFEFWCPWLLRLLKWSKTRQCSTLQKFCGEQLQELVEVCQSMRPPPLYYDISNAGCDFINGRYHFVGRRTDDGHPHVRGGDDLRYELAVSVMERPLAEGSDSALVPRLTKMTLFRCLMRNRRKWWFLSEADEEQPGTDRDIDYYQYKTQSGQADVEKPPAENWRSCPSHGIDPPPLLTPSKEFAKPIANGAGGTSSSSSSSLIAEEELAKWLLENRVLDDFFLEADCDLKPTSTGKDSTESCSWPLVEQALPMWEMLASLPESSPYRLQEDHLIGLWKVALNDPSTTTRTSGHPHYATSIQIGQLLLELLPLVPSSYERGLHHAIMSSTFNTATSPSEPVKHHKIHSMLHTVSTDKLLHAFVHRMKQEEKLAAEKAANAETNAETFGNGTHKSNGTRARSFGEAKDQRHKDEDNDPKPQEQHLDEGEWHVVGRRGK